jgi:hypothetical protein
MYSKRYRGGGGSGGVTPERCGALATMIGAALAPRVMKSISG